MTKLVTFLQDESGTNAIEYALIATLLGVAIIGVVSTLAQDVRSLFNSVGAGL
jgi:pilus assembly protein Flp/PilA